ncbi:succinate-semialdehyde dehydrogenase (NAD(P)(+)) [Saccharomycopsis crataegensis]|uniref:Succinate-semialdehyde dehydrogenase n=1 Tax=Saccharomycopsis crataegensis TaxID=43959 RepID=A0AAV5QH55_9ASCO|nr:succinate-semialdehyde dehydrogenase (NAD(P)(+)) [Saccharomycopsis crataegensis]
MIRARILTSTSSCYFRSVSIRQLSVKTMSSTISLKNSSLLQTQALINGEFVNGSVAAGETTFEVQNPATNEHLISITNTNNKDFQTAINAASAAFTGFRKTTARARSNLLYNLYELVLENKEDLAKIITLENGKSYTDSLGEVAYAASFLQWFAEEAPRVNGDIIPSVNPANRVLTIKQPLGVCGVLTPWNFPAAMITRKLGALLAAGNTAVIKPAAETPLTALAIGKLVIDAGFPKGVVNIVPTSHKNTPAAGEFICEHPVVKKVSFTGSTAVGKLLARQSASTMKKLSFELGGNAPFIVFDDADLKKAIPGVIASKFRQSGQTCVCANRIFVHEAIYDEFAAKLVEEVSKFKLGHGLVEGVTHGPLIHERSLNKINSLVHDAKSKDAKVLIGGSPATSLGPFFYHPTVLGDVTPKMDIFNEEIFGPVASLVKFKTDEEVIALANDTSVGLAGYFYSEDISRIFNVAESLEVGMVGANTGAISEASVPFGGIKESGLGREGSMYGIHDWLNIKTIVIGNI